MTEQPSATASSPLSQLSQRARSRLHEALGENTMLRRVLLATAAAWLVSVIAGRLLIFDSAQLAYAARVVPKSLGIVGLVMLWVWLQGQRKRSDGLKWLRGLEQQVELRDYYELLSRDNAFASLRLKVLFSQEVDTEVRERIVGAINGYLGMREGQLLAKAVWSETSCLLLSPEQRVADANRSLVTNRDVHQWFYNIVGLCVPVIRTQAPIETVSIVREPA